MLTLNANRHAQTISTLKYFTNQIQTFMRLTNRMDLFMSMTNQIEPFMLDNPYYVDMSHLEYS